MVPVEHVFYANPRRSQVRPKTEEKLSPQATRVIAQVAVIALVIGVLLGIGTTPVATPDMGAGTQAELGPHPVWTVEHSAITAPAEAQPPTF